MVVVATLVKLAQTPLLRFDTGDSILDRWTAARSFRQDRIAPSSTGQGGALSMLRPPGSS
jgi:hypothetical protein